MNIINFYNQNKIYILIGIISIIFTVILLGCLFLPNIFYDQFIWRFFWGPIESDAKGYPISYNGILAEEKYTIISELIYGFLIITVIFGLYKLIKKWDITINWWFCLSILPFIISGSITRVLEDSEFFVEPIVYLFITPIIYFQILLLFLLFLIIGYYIQNKFKQKYLNIYTILFFSGILFLIPFLYFTYQWLVGNQWGTSNPLRFDVFFLVIALVFLVTFIVFLTSKLFKKHRIFPIFSLPLNLAMISGHFIDGVTSYISIYDPLKMGIPSYYELHPASDFIMNIWPPLFPIIKFLLIIFVIYIFDVVYKKDFENYPNLVNLLKIGIFILGFAPGLRDLLRVLMGV